MKIQGALTSDDSAKFISKILSPYIVAPITVFVSSYGISNSLKSASLYTILFFLLTVAPALTYILVQMQRGIISDIHVKNREQRYPIFIIGIFSVLITLGVLYLISAPFAVLGLIVTLLVVVILSYAVNKKSKVSIHTSTLAGSSVIFYLLVGPVVGLLVLLLTFLNIWSRVKTKAHTLQETLLGLFIGLTITLIVLQLFV